VHYWTDLETVETSLFNGVKEFQIGCDHILRLEVETCGGADAAARGLK
jgi:hypothetical protein